MKIHRRTKQQQPAGACQQRNFQSSGSDVSRRSYVLYLSPFARRSRIKGSVNLACADGYTCPSYTAKKTEVSPRCSPKTRGRSSGVIAHRRNKQNIVSVSPTTIRRSHSEQSFPSLPPLLCLKQTTATTTTRLK